MKNVAFLAVAMLPGCATHMTLDPSFAQNAVEQSVDVPGYAGLVAPELTLGFMRMTEADLARGPYKLAAPGLTMEGDWRLHAKLQAQHAGVIDCVGPTALKTRGRQPDAPTIGCAVHDGTHAWTAGFDPIGRRDGRWFVGRMLDAAGRELTIEQSGRFVGQVEVGNVLGYYVRFGDTIVGALDVSFRGQPKAWIARDVDANIRDGVAASLVTTYVIHTGQF